MRVNGRYSDEFRNDALNLLRQGDRSLRQVAADLGVNHWTLRDWYNGDLMARRAHKRPLPATPRANENAEQKVARLEREVGRLQRENDQLRRDREILKKAAAFFVKESE